MITRIWRTEVRPERLEEYEAFAAEISLPMFRGQPGCEGVLMFRDGSNCHVLTLWRSQSDIDRLDSSPSYSKTVERILASGFLKGSQATKAFETHLLWMAMSHELPFDAHPRHGTS